MNTNPKAIRVLCYGDSNTWETRLLEKPRFAANVRWPGKLQDLLGPSYEIIEEGLCGRTTDLTIRKKKEEMEKHIFSLVFELTIQIDFFILLLGINDFKAIYNRSAEDVAKSIEGLINIVKNLESAPEWKTPKILLISPTLLIETTEKYKGAADKSKQLGPLLEKVALNNSVPFIDLAKFVEPGSDGAHLTAQGHSKTAELVADTIKKNV